MALTEIPIELSSTPSIVDGGNATAITIAASGATTVTADTTSDWALAVSNGTNSNAFGLYVNAPSTSGIPLRVDGGGSELMRILPTGGITFNGDTAQANALNDYEEGAWTPSLIRSDGTVAATNVVVGANYVKIGRTVIIKAWVHTINATGTNGSGYWTITGLPFSSTSYGAMALAYNTTGADTIYTTSSFSVMAVNGGAYSGSLSGGFMMCLAYETTE
tara:strand:- start:45 stop:701 length:657 start_codon:yes stop_codon:yes gene_type:complete